MRKEEKTIIAIAAAVVFIIIFGIIANPLIGHDKIELETREKNKEQLIRKEEDKPIEFVEIKQEEKTGIYFETSYIYSEEETDGVDKEILTKYDGDTQLWSAEFEALNIDEYVSNDEKVVVYGRTEWDEELQTFYPWIGLLDSNGNIIWKIITDDIKTLYRIDKAIIEDDHIVVFGSIGKGNICMIKYDFNGEQIFYKVAEEVNGYVRQYIKYEEMYIVYIQTGLSNGGKVYQFGTDGSCEVVFTCDGKKDSYNIVDMLEHNGNVYFSTELEEEFSISQFDWENDFYEYNGDSYLRKGVLNDYKKTKNSVLFKYNISSGKTEVAQKVFSAMPAELEIGKDNEIIWNVEEIITAAFSPATSSFSIYSNTQVSQCIFDENGKYLELKKTDEIRYFQE